MIDVTQCYTRPIKWTDINELEKTISKLEQQEKHKLSLSDQRNQIKKKWLCLTSLSNICYIWVVE